MLMWPSTNPRKTCRWMPLPTSSGPTARANISGAHPMIRPKNLGLDYLRRSTEKQEISLPRQLDFAITAARQHGVAFDATAADLAHMQAARLHTFKALRLDDGLTGSDLSRPGFLALNRDALADTAVSHVFF